MNVIAVAHNDLLDELLVLRRIMAPSAEPFDPELNNVRFISFDSMSSSIQGGEFFSAPVDVALFFENNPRKSEYESTQEQIRQWQKLCGCYCSVFIYTAPKDTQMEDEPKTLSLDDDGLRSLHIPHESFEPHEEIALKMMSVLSCFANATSKDSVIASLESHRQIPVKISKAKFTAAILYSYGLTNETVETINEKIVQFKGELAALNKKKKKKYECNFAPAEHASTAVIEEGVSPKRAELLDCCSRATAAAAKDTERFQTQTTADVALAQRTIASVFYHFAEDEKVDRDAVRESNFASEEIPPEALQLIDRSRDDVGSQVVDFRLLIPMFRLAKEYPAASAAERLKSFVIALGSVAIGVGGGLAVRYFMQSGSMSIRDGLLIAGGALGAVLLAHIAALIAQVLRNGRLRGYIRSAIAAYCSYFQSNVAATDNARKYINRYVTVAINAFTQTRPIEKKLAQINALEKRKGQLEAEAKYLERIERAIADDSTSVAIDQSKNLLALKQLIEAPRDDSKDVNFPPKKAQDLWLTADPFSLNVL